MSWKKELEKNITEAEHLLPYVPLNREEMGKMRQLLQQFPMSITPYYMSLIDFEDPDDPIRKMAIPSLEEEDLSGSFDTSGEGQSTVIEGIQHKYTQTLMVLSTSQCAMYCRHCFRKRMVGAQSDEVAKQGQEMDAYLWQHPEISNVLISGGDALLNSNEYLEEILSYLCKHPNLQTVRIASRVPVVFPQRITEDKKLLSILNHYNKLKRITLITQYNHEREINDTSLSAVGMIQAMQIPVKNQTVLLRGVNDSASALSALLKKLVAGGIQPYYVFQCRPVSGVKTQFQLPLEEGYQLVQQAKNEQNGLGKSFRYCLSHYSGKLEILGMYQGEMVFQYHEARNTEDLGKIVHRKLAPGQTWLEDDVLL